MGFFDSKSSQTQTYDNPELRQYTALYRGASPFGFATLDPTATLAAMGQGTTITSPGKGKKTIKTDLGADFKRTLEGLSAEEKKSRQDTQDSLARIKDRQESGQFLTAEETSFINTSLDKAFEYAHKTGLEDWAKATRAMAGRQGLRTSDTPIADPSMRELGNFELGLGSQRAKMGLDATLQFSQNQQLFDQNFVQFNQQLAQNKWATRQGFLFGGGLDAASKMNYTNQIDTTQKASGFQQVMGAMSIASAGFDLIGKVGSTAQSFGAPFSFPTK